MNANTKIAQPNSDPINKSSAPPGMILPDGIVDFSDDLSNDDDDDDMLDDDDLKLKRTLDSTREVADRNIEKMETDPGKSKLRIKTGGIYMNCPIECSNCYIFIFSWENG